MSVKLNAACVASLLGISIRELNRLVADGHIAKPVIKRGVRLWTGEQVADYKRRHLPTTAEVR